MSRLRLLHVALSFALLLSWCAPVAGGDSDAPPIASGWKPDVSAGLGYHYSVGDYGLSRDTEVMYVPFIARLEMRSAALQLTLPYIYIRGPEGIFGILTGTQESESIHDAGGLGDIMLDASYRVAPYFRLMPWVDLRGQVKFPTASESAGLGTGAFDFGVAVDAYWQISKAVLIVGAGRRFLGDADDFALRDVFTASGGGVYSLWEPLDVGALVDFQEATSTHSEVSVDLIPYLRWRFLTRASVDVYASFGLADGSPDYAGGVQLSYQLW